MTTMFNDFDTGFQSSVAIIVPGYGRVDFDIVESFETKPEYKTPEVDPLNGPKIQKSIPNGHTFSFAIKRKGRGADAFFARLETGYWAGGRIPLATMYHFFEEADGSQTTFEYSNVTLRLSNAGSFKNGEAVDQTVEGFASTKRQIA